MTKIQAIMDNVGMSVYRFVKLMGGVPEADTTRWQRKLKGEMSISRQEAVKIAHIFSQCLNAEVSVSELGLETERLLFK